MELKFTEIFNSINNFNDIFSLIKITPLLIFGVIIYWIYTSLAWRAIARKLRHRRSYLAWVPFARKAMILDMTGFNWRLIFIALIPFLIILIKIIFNITETSSLLIAFLISTLLIEIITKISIWKAFQKRHYFGWIAFLPAIGWFSFTEPILNIFASTIFLIVLGFVAWRNR